MNGLIERVERSIFDHRLLARGDSVLVAVSGGLDSMVLLDVLATLAPQHQWRLTVAHFNHQLRAEADEEEQFVAAAARKLGLEFKTERADVEGFALSAGVSIEMAARTLRHRFLAETAVLLNIQHCALAHHADDQVELFFIRLFRGAGTQGLGGMEWSSPSQANMSLTLIRPLLGESKRDLAAHAEARGLRFCEDVSNADTTILRNRVRHKLLPLLRKDFSASIDASVLRSMELVRDEGDFVTIQAIEWLKPVRARIPFADLHVALQRRVVQIELLANGIVPQFHHVEELRAERGKWVAIGPSIICRRTPRGRVECRMVRSPKLEVGEMMWVVDNPQGESVYDGLHVSYEQKLGSELPARVPGREVFDARYVGSQIVLRHWREGDRFRPIGMASPLKLQDWFVNLKVPRERRHELVIATTAAGEIFWVEDQRIGEMFKVTAETRRLLEWRWRRQ